MKEPIQILLLEDNAGDARLIREYLKESQPQEFALTHFTHLAAGLEDLKMHSPDAILLDLGLPDSQGLDSLIQITSYAPQLTVIILTGLMDVEISVKALQAGAQDYLIKGEFTSDFLIRVIRYAIERKQTENTLRNNEQEILKRNQEINLLYEAGQEISKSLSLEHIYRSFYESISENMSCDTLIIAGYDPLTQLITAQFVIAEGNQAEVSTLPPIPLEPEGYGIQSPVIRSGNARIVNDYLAEIKKVKTNYYIDDDGKVAEEGCIPEDGQYTQSSLIIPMKLKNQVIGVVQIQSYQKDAYTPEDFRIAQSLVSQITVAANNAVLYQQSLEEIENRKQVEYTVLQQATEIKKNNENLTRLYRISNALIQGSVLDRDPLLQLIVNTVAAELDKISCCLFLLNPARNEFECVASSLQPSELLMWATIGIENKELFSGIVARKVSLYIPDVLIYHPAVAALPSARAILIVPMIVSGHDSGVIFIQSPEPDRVTPDDEQWLNLYASQAAVVLENTSLLSETKTQLGRLESLRKIDDTINASMDLKVTGEVLLDQITNQLQVDAADLLLFDPGSMSLNFITYLGFRTSPLQLPTFRLGQGFAGQAASTRQILHITNLKEHENLLRTSPLLKEENFVVYFGVPLIAKGALKGVLEIYHRSPLTVNASWLNFLEALAGQSAIALDNIDMFGSLQKSINELVMAYDENIEAWSRALDLRDEETEGHTQRVVKITLDLAKALGMGDEELVHLRRGALLHDIGKMGIPDRVLLKPGPLTEQEWQIMRKHPAYAYELLSPITFLKQALDIPYCHHEKWDGSGYPRGLKGEDIPLAARIFAVVDVWDALRSDRPYRAGWSEDQAFEYIREQAGKQFDPQVVELFFNSYIFENGASVKPTILIVDDEEDVTRSLARSLKNYFTVLTANNCADALKIAQRSGPEVILTDQRMPDMTGVELLEHVRRSNPNTSGILISGYSDVVALTAAINLGNVRGFIPKPWDIENLRARLDEAVHYYREKVREKAVPDYR